MLLAEQPPAAGADPAARQGATGYADLLYSITDNDQLFRDGGLLSTDTFIDSMTQV